MDKQKILENAKRWAKKGLLNEPLQTYWEEYQEYEELSFREFISLVLTGSKQQNSNVVSMSSYKEIKPVIGIDTFLQLSIKKERNYG